MWSAPIDLHSSLIISKGIHLILRVKETTLMSVIGLISSSERNDSVTCSAK